MRSSSARPNPGLPLLAAAARMACLAALVTSAADARGEMRLAGVNIAGAEFGEHAIPGRPGTDYFYPTSATIDYFAAKGMNVVRIPFMWERLQPELGHDLSADEMGRLDAVVSAATSKGMTVVLDVHNYAAYQRQPIGTPAVPTDALAGLWGRLATHYKDDGKIIFGLMNEPKDLRTETWLEAANAAIAEIRRRGAKNLILVPGNGWTGAHSWLGHSYGASNGEVMLGVVDPANNFAYEVHQYLDENFSGTNPRCTSETIGVETLAPFTQWLRQNHQRGFLGEFGGGSDPTCLAALDGMLKFMSDNGDVWLGWTYWAAGAWPKDYFTSVQPVDGADRPQMAILVKHIAEKDVRSPK